MFGFKQEGEKMSKVYEHHKQEQDIFDTMPTISDVDQELYLVETVKVMKLARNLLNDHVSDSSMLPMNDLEICLTKLQEQINTAEETILQFEIDIEEMAKHYG